MVVVGTDTGLRTTTVWHTAAMAVDLRLRTTIIWQARSVVVAPDAAVSLGGSASVCGRPQRANAVPHPRPGRLPAGSASPVHFVVADSFFPSLRMT